jgi:transcriptional regulator with XRE-family HTH domain
MNNIKEIVGDNIRKYRVVKNMTQEQLGKLIDKKHGTISAWETGRSAIDIETLSKVCEVLGVEFYQIYGINPESYSDDEVCLVEKYRQLDESTKGCIDIVIDAKSKEETCSQKNRIS